MQCIAITLPPTMSNFEICHHDGCPRKGVPLCLSLYNQHMAKHTPGSLSCTVPGCLFKCKHARNLRAHERIHDAPLVCDLDLCNKEGQFLRKCAYTTASLSHLEAHKATVHRRERKFECGIDGCTYKASNQSNLNVHQRRHSADGPTFVCPYCVLPATYSAYSKSNLTSHVKRHHGDL